MIAVDTRNKWGAGVPAGAVGPEYRLVPACKTALLYAAASKQRREGSGLIFLSFDILDPSHQVSRRIRGGWNRGLTFLAICIPGDTAGYLTGATYNIESRMTGNTLGNGVVQTWDFDDDRWQLVSQTAIKGAYGVSISVTLRERVDVLGLWSNAILVWNQPLRFELLGMFGHGGTMCPDFFYFRSVGIAFSLLVTMVNFTGCSRRVVSVQQVDKMVQEQVPIGSDKQQILDFIDNLKIDSLETMRDGRFKEVSKQTLANCDPEKIAEGGDRIAEYTAVVILRAQKSLLTVEHIVIRFYVDTDGRMIDYSVKMAADK